MTEGEAKALETDVVIFPINFNRENQETKLTEETTAEIAVDKSLIKSDIEIRFVRLKKSLRKRSASIL